MTSTALSPRPAGPEMGQPVQPEQQNRVELFLPELDDEKVNQLDELNSAYHEHKENVWRREYNNLDNKKIQQQLRQDETLVDAKQRIAETKANRDALQSTETYIDEELMPVFAEGIDEEDPRYQEIRDSLMRVATMDEFAWKGEEDEDGNRQGGLMEQLQTSQRPSPNATPNTPANTPEGEEGDDNAAE
jgi:hypothetical protein